MALALLVAIRPPQSVPDTEAYRNHFLEASLNHFFRNIRRLRFEVGYEFLTAFFRTVYGTNSRLFFGTIALINFSLITFFLCKAYDFFRVGKEFNVNKQKFVLYSLIIYLAFYGAYSNMIVLRSGLGISFFFGSLVYLNKSKFKGLMLFLIGFSFHTSIIFGLIGLILFLLKIKNQKVLIFWWSLIVLIYFSFISFYIIPNILEYAVTLPFLSRYAFYVNELAFADLNISWKFIVNLIFAFIIIMQNKLSFLERKFILILLAALTIQSILSSLVLVERISDIFMAFHFILLGYYFARRSSNSLFFLCKIGFVVSILYIFVIRIIF
ncbi:MAG: EpsG family protein [Erysipelotrichales bacterium]|nr:EpsG family protein [Erysipelotrichales bacterium]